jgi:PEP-CTERM motif
MRVVITLGRKAADEARRRLRLRYPLYSTALALQPAVKAGLTPSPNPVKFAWQRAICIYPNQFFQKEENMKGNRLAVLVLAAALGFASAAMAEELNFSFSGGGISASGTFTVSQSSPGVDEITGISGTFSDRNVGVSGAITGLYQPVSYVSNTLASPGVAFTTGGLSYDDTFYPAGNSPAICYDLNPATGKPELTYPFSGGVFDIFGVAFDIGKPGGYVGELWSNGDVGGGPIVYAAGLASATKLLDDPNSSPTSPIPPGEFGTLTTSAVPEPASLVLFGIGLLGIMALWVRKMNRLRSPRMWAGFTGQPAAESE